MNINKEQIDDVNIVLSLDLSKDDYASKVNDILREHRRKASMPGFRPGKVPEGLIRKMYGKAVLVEEINKLVNEALQKYFKEQNMNLLGNPLPKANEEDFDWEIGNDFCFKFDVGVAPVVDVALSKEDKITKYQIVLEPKYVENVVENHAKNYGQYTYLEEVVDFSEVVDCDIIQIGEDLQPLENGLSVKDANVLLSLIKDEELKKPFEKAKSGDEIMLNLWETFPNDWEVVSILKKKNKDELGDVDITTAQFKLTVKSVRKFVNAELNQTLFDNVFGENQVKSLEEFKERVEESLKKNYEESSMSRFVFDMNDYLLQKLNPALPEDFLRRWFIASGNFADEEKLMNDLPQMLKGIKWDVISNAIARSYNIKIEDSEIITFAEDTVRRQFAMYGASGLSDENINNYAMNMLKNEDNMRRMVSNVLNDKIAKLVLEKCDIQIQEISVEDFNNK